MFEQIPLEKPDTPLLDTINSPADLRKLEESQLETLAYELRHFLLYTVGQTGGHFGAGLGVVELTIALHYIFNTPEDRIVWDVGHQCYPHKILTGRREGMAMLRRAGGISGFPKREESEYDTFGVGHSSTSISAALGMALAARAQGIDRKAVAVIGDGAMTAGMAFEALHHAAHTRANMLVVLNDNQMSIGHNVGGLASYFAQVWASRLYTSVREGGKKVLAKIPPAWELVKRTEEHMKGMVAPATLFEELGFNYIGPMDGHDLDTLVHTIGNMAELDGPQLLHVMTQKGKGFKPAEKDPVGYHAINKIEPKKTKALTPTTAAKPKYQRIFGDWLCDMAAADERLIGITPAMCEGSGMVEFAERFPERYHDVAIAEQHAVTLAAGLACDGMKPVVAIYSTFLQRAYDQLIHDVALQNLDVTFGIDRAGIVGQDGATHTGNFDLSFLRCIPNLVIAAPSDENECRQLLSTCYQHPGPAAVRYPRGTGPGAELQPGLEAVEIGKAVIKRQSNKAGLAEPGVSTTIAGSVAILNFGVLLPEALQAAEAFDATVVDMRFVKPLDETILEQLANHELWVTVEENTISGGAGSAVVEWLDSRALTHSVLQIGLPDEFPPHGKPDVLREQYGLTASGIEKSIAKRLNPH